MIRTIITEYEPYQRSIRHIRDEVFLKEQNIAREDELDDRDEICVHALAFVDEEPVGTGRLDVENDFKVGRIAVLPEYRRRGVGSALMQAFEDYVKSLESQAETSHLWFYAQQSAVDFYLALGYETVGDEFMEAGIPHIRMQKRLS